MVIRMVTSVGQTASGVYGGSFPAENAGSFSKGNMDGLALIIPREMPTDVHKNP